ncbi:MAG: tRNA (adenosine(37)-N6)-dimethylallyltransferase MiaA [Sulfurospirillaceae bacterium]|nr:tRNA (adenosine(37)-N6)-dimethylallyltransferase MiaA [Sulfurospirillaceae bacterium]
MKTIAILGPTASGKTSLSIELATEYNANILSLDSLSIYKEIDIASAKPTLEERGNIKHFGIDEIFPDETFNVSIYFDFYKKAMDESIKNSKNLIIVGGTGFYLKSLISGLSNKPIISNKTKEEVAKTLLDLDQAYEILSRYDTEYANKISSNDAYRIEKWFEIYIESGITVSDFFQENKQKPLIDNLDIFEIEVSKDDLREKISLRTEIMIQNGLIDEAVYLENRYTRTPNSLKSIGIKETFEYLDGLISKDELKEKIVTNTAKLAKRQMTFNKTQFENRIVGNTDLIFKEAKEIFNL